MALHIWDAIRSLGASLRASASVGRSSRLLNGGNAHAALVQAREGLALLARPYVRRFKPNEGSSLLTLTILAEEAAAQLGQDGASIQDLTDCLKLLDLHRDALGPELLAPIPFLEQCLAAAIARDSARDPSSGR